MENAHLLGKSNPGSSANSRRTSVNSGTPALTTSRPFHSSWAWRLSPAIWPYPALWPPQASLPIPETPAPPTKPAVKPERTSVKARAGPAVAPARAPAVMTRFAVKFDAISRQSPPQPAPSPSHGERNLPIKATQDGTGVILQTSQGEVGIGWLPAQVHSPRGWTHQAAPSSP